MSATPSVPHRLLPGPAGDIEIFVDAPTGAPCGIAIVAHPQPLMGGNAQHKIPQLLARACRDLGWLAVRPNFRGVGATAGSYDHGGGETDDLVVVADALRAEHPGLPLALIGFSFGAYVQAHVAARLAVQGRPADHVVLAGPPTGTVDSGRAYALPMLPKGSVVIHGEADEAIPLSALLDWARPSGQPITVVPGADHFFGKGRLVTLRALLEAALRSGPGPANPSG